LWLNDHLKQNRLRYLSLFAGLFLFLAPFALFTRVLYLLIGNMAEPTLHTICYRMPIDWLFAGRYYQLIGSVSAYFILAVVILSFFLGPVFCGWLCPVGSVSEGISRIIPLPEKYRVKLKDTNITTGLRYGFIAGFIIVAAVAGRSLVQGLSSICCRYCSASVLQNFSSALFGDVSAIGYWHSGSIIVLFSWLVLGGVMFSGGRGWCLFFCPLGALSNISHKIGARFGLFNTKFDKEKCVNCEQCNVFCPMQAVKEDHSVETGLCVNCLECTHSCAGKAYSYQRGE